MIDYSDIAPYRDDEVRAAIYALLKELSFVRVLRFVYPDMSDDEIQLLCQNIDSVKEFQAKVAYPAMMQMNRSTISKLTHTGFEQLEDGKASLFISNHRDIILDSALLNMLLHEHCMSTTETAIGSNLLKNETVKHLTKLNRNFTVNRDVQRRELHAASHKLSSYIRDAITERNTSVWISQREGRAKNGDDRTQQGLLKMLAMSGDKDLKSNFEALRIRPLALSYEYDPCDLYKVIELTKASRGEEHIKEENEDLSNIIAGISGVKGRVHLEIGPRLAGDILNLDANLTVNEQISQLTSIVDQHIHAQAHLWPNNYIAADLLAKSTDYSEQYTEEDLKQFEEYRFKIVEGLAPEDRETQQQILIQKYAFPVINKESLLINLQ